MIAPDRAGSINGSSPARMVEVWRRIYAVLGEAQQAMEDSHALHARDFSTPDAFALARVQHVRDLSALTHMRSRALSVFTVWDALPKPTAPPPKPTLMDVWNESARRHQEGSS